MPPGEFDRTYGANPAENYEQYFVPVIGEPMARDLIARAALQPADRVLDVACGTGIVARLAGHVVAGRGSVAGLDANAAMLAVARTAGPDIEWYEAPAEQMPFADAAFDVVLCQMGLQFISDRPQAMREMRRVLADGGRVLLSLPGPISGIFAAFGTALEHHVGPDAAGFVRHVFCLYETAEMERLLRDAGFRDSVVNTTTQTLRLPAPHQFLWEYVHSTPLAGMVAMTGAEVRRRLENDLVAAWADFGDSDGLIQQQGVTIAVGYA